MLPVHAADRRHNTLTTTLNPPFAGLTSTFSPTAATVAPEASEDAGVTLPPRPPPTPSSLPPAHAGAGAWETDSSDDDDDFGLGSVIAASVIGAFLLAVFVLTCIGLRSHCVAKGKSIRRSLETLVAKGSFWGAILVLFGLMVGLNAYTVSMLWTTVSVFGTVVMSFGIVAWFIAFQTGTPAVVSLELPRRSAPTSVRGDSDDRTSGGAGDSRRSISTCDTPHGCSFAASPTETELPTWVNGRGSGQSAATAAPATPTRNAVDSFFPDTFVRAVYIPAHSVDGLQP